ncbi:MAG: hypothetical protein IIA14_05990 [SAR324 cluster bacterium]|nr:hypothetical protein [SAR324 cluster bacterium]
MPTPPPDSGRIAPIQLSALGDPDETITRLREEIRGWEAYWEQKQNMAEAAAGSEAPAATEAAQIRRLLRGLVGPKLDEIASHGGERKSLYLNVMVPFDTGGGLRDFLFHFFQIAETGQGATEFAPRDPFERDVYVLYDLYRVKKTLEVIGALKAARSDPARKFSSIFSEEQIGTTLDSLTMVLELLFAQCLPEQHRREMLPGLSPAMLQGRSLLERREQNLLYTFPHVLEKYVYRRFFFLIFFKDGLRARMEGEERDFKYNFLHFQVIKQEFLVHWLTGPLRDNPAKFAVYRKYALRGKTLLEWIVEKPAEEQALLSEVSAPVLNDMASQVNEVVAEELKIGAVPRSENFGFYRRLKEQLVEAVDLVKKPIETLREIVKAETLAPAAPARPAPPPPKAPEPPPAPPPEPRWEISLLKKNQLPRPFFINSLAGFQSQLSALRVKMGTGYREFSGYVSELLENTPEMTTIRRRTPKHEWVMPYRIRRIVPDETLEYLLILGAEVKAKQMGMSYGSAKQNYAFTPYFVFATDDEKGGFGESVSERRAANHTLKEYSCQNPAVIAKVLELIELLKEKNR